MAAVEGPGAGAARFLSWNLAGLNDACDDATQADIASSLLALKPHIVALQGLDSGLIAEALCESLGDGWSVVTVATASNGIEHMAILVDSTARISSRSLPELPTQRQALAATVEIANTDRLRIVSCMSDPVDAETRRRYVEGLIEWANLHRGTALVLAGSLYLTQAGEGNADQIARHRLEERFGLVQAGDDSGGSCVSGSVYFSSDILSVQRAFVACGVIPPVHGRDVEMPVVVDFVFP